MPETSPNESAHSASVPSEIEIHLQYQQRVTEIAVACANAVDMVSTQAEIFNIPGNKAQGCDPQVFRWSVEKLWEAIVPVEGGGIETDPYACKKPVKVPGFRRGSGTKRRPIYSTSYHNAAIKLACELYQRLAFVGLEFAVVKCGQYCDDEGVFHLWSVPEFQSFATTPWPLDLAKLVLAEAREADPVINVNRFNAELSTRPRSIP